MHARWAITLSQDIGTVLRKEFMKKAFLSIIFLAMAIHSADLFAQQGYLSNALQAELLTKDNTALEKQIQINDRKLKIIVQRSSAAGLPMYLEHPLLTATGELIPAGALIIYLSTREFARDLNTYTPKGLFPVFLTLSAIAGTAYSTVFNDNSQYYQTVISNMNSTQLSVEANNLNNQSIALRSEINENKKQIADLLR